MDWRVREDAGPACWVRVDWCHRKCLESADPCSRPATQYKPLGPQCAGRCSRSHGQKVWRDVAETNVCTELYVAWCTPAPPPSRLPPGTVQLETLGGVRSAATARSAGCLVPFVPDSTRGRCAAPVQSWPSGAPLPGLPGQLSDRTISRSCVANISSQNRLV